jgi:hypothetical protein
MDGPRLAVREMKRRDWQALADALPRLDDCKDLQRALKFFASGYGWQRLEGLPGDEHGRRYLPADSEWPGRQTVPGWSVPRGAGRTVGYRLRTRSRVRGATRTAAAALPCAQFRAVRMG